jgi:predicted O-methyltransferase YrrM
MDLGQQEFKMEHFYHNIEGWSSESEQGELLKTILPLINTNQKIKIAEIGVYQGRGTSMWNTILINENLEYEYKAIDHFEGSSEHNKSIDYYGITIDNLKPIIDKIEVIKNDSVSESKNYDNEYFDIVYIDASHEYELVIEDIKNWLPKVKKGGIICGDDYISGWPSVILAVDEIFNNKVNVVGAQQWWIKL